MRFAEIQGNDELRRALAGMIHSGRIPHALMLHEDDGGGGLRIALAFLQMLFCENPSDGDSCGACSGCNRVSKLIHPDIHFVFPLVSKKISRMYLEQWRSLVLSNPCFTERELGEAMGIESKNTAITVDEAKFILDTLSLSALEGWYRAVVIYLPEKLNREAANRLLKTIEEPEPRTQLIFITHSPESVLPTIASRCQTFRVLPSGRRIISDETYASMLDSLMQALLSRNLLAALEAGDTIAALPSRENAKAFCIFAAERLREVFLIQQGLGSLCSPDNGNAAQWAAGCKKTFVRGALASLSRAKSLIERNVNAKILFSDLVNRLYIIV
ncbi:MAG: hypothetical protein IJU69_04250 [Bacteroidales bacterium]|nr:hypothetical protein [Bacteroidales bacterium]